jgi:rod shape-determining protein MreD
VIRTILFSTILLVASGIVQSTWLGAIAVWGVIPDISLVILVWLSYKNGIVEGPISGFIAGFAEDCLSASPLGFHAFVKTFVAAAAGLLHGSFFIDRVFLPFALGAVATLFKALAAGILALLFGAKIQTYNFLDRVLWIEAAYNGLIAPLVFLLLGVMKRLLVTESKRR